MLATNAPAAPQNQHAALDAELASIASDPACQLASLSVLVIGQAKLKYEQQFGQRFLETAAKAPQAANARTLYRIASISKMMTTLAAMRLVEDGTLALDADVSDYLGYALRNPHFRDRAITLRALLTHTSSLRDAAGYFFPCTTTLKSFLLTDGALHGSGKMWASNAAPGDYFTYSNLGWGVIGTIMERVSGERFDCLMKRLLLDPLGMRGGYNVSEFSPEDLGNLATLYRKRTTDTEIWNSSGPWIAQVDDYSTQAPQRPEGIDDYVIGTNATAFSPAGGLRMSAADMGKVMHMLINDGMHEGRQILKPATLASMLTRQWIDNGSNGDTQQGLFQCWGLGNQQFPEGGSGHQVEGGHFSGVGHLGEAYGLMSVFVVDLINKNGMVALVGGVSSDPEQYKGTYSSMARFQEKILTAMHQRMIASQRS